jgi:hypothetical protein
MARVKRNRESVGPATLGSTLAAHLTLIVWCKACPHQVEPDIAEQVARYGAGLALPDGPRGCGAQNATAETLISSSAGRGAELPPPLPRHSPALLDAFRRVRPQSGRGFS